MSAPSAAAISAGETNGRFYGNKREYWRLLTREALSLIVTLGLYRFWVSTDVRRYLWSRTDLAGEQLDYTGDPHELLVGFLVLLVVLGPLVAIANILNFTTGSFSDWIVYLPLFLLVPLGVLVLYQSRRYRVNNTVFRGLRFHQTGSAWLYALRTALWFFINLLTLGLTYPWARASLERYKMRHTFYGDVQGSFAGSAWQLFKRGVLLWAVIVLPLFIGLSSFDLGVPDSASNEQVLAASLAALTRAMGPPLLLIVIVYPIFHAVVLRWRIAGMRFGSLSFESKFSTWGLYKAYLKFYGLLLLLVIVATAIAVVVELKVVPAVPLGSSLVAEFLGVVCLVIFYFVVLTIAAFAYQGTVRFDTWRLIVNSLVLRGAEQLDRAKVNVAHAARHAGRIGAALNLGGF